MKSLPRFILVGFVVFLLSGCGNITSALLTRIEALEKQIEETEETTQNLVKIARESREESREEIRESVRRHEDLIKSLTDVTREDPGLSARVTGLEDTTKSIADFVAKNNDNARELNKLIEILDEKISILRQENLNAAAAIAQLQADIAGL